MRNCIVVIWLTILCSCTISSKISGPGLKKNASGIVVITHTRLSGKGRGMFFDKIRNLYGKLNEYDGFIAGSIRIDIFGDEAWTLSIWQSEKALKTFVYSQGHLDAMYMGSMVMKEMRRSSFSTRDASVVSWDLALEKIEAAPFRRMRGLF